MNRRQLLLGTAAIAGAAALPATAPAALAGDQEVHRLLDQMLRRRMAEMQARYTKAIEEAILYGRGDLASAFAPIETPGVGQLPSVRRIAALDPTWQQPRDDG